MHLSAGFLNLKIAATAGQGAMSALSRVPENGRATHPETRTMNFADKPTD
jgi:hypothetical protein